MPDTVSTPRFLEWESELQRILRSTGSAAEPQWFIRSYTQVSSTMDAARGLLAEVSPQRPGIVLARRQIAGRGRRGRTWEEAGGALYLTVIFAAARLPPDIGAFGPTVGCVLHDFFETHACPVKIKWPNDIWSEDRRKLAGVLIESVSAASMQCLIVGIGVNLSEAPPSLPEAAALPELCGRRISPVQAAGQLAPALWRAWGLFERQGFSAFKKDWLSHAMLVGEAVTVDTGIETTTGRCLGISGNGALLLEADGVTKEIAAGDICPASAKILIG